MIRQALLGAAFAAVLCGPAWAQALAPAAASAPMVDGVPEPAPRATTAPDPQATDTNAVRARTQPGNNAPFWRGVRESGQAPGTVNNRNLGEAGVLVQTMTQYPGTHVTTAGEAWRQIRNWWIIPYGGALLVIAALAIGLYYWRKGPMGGHEPNTGRLIERFTYFERASHWVNAVAFVILAVSGIVMAWGKFFLLPLMGGLLFGWLTWFLKTAHNFAGPLFAVSLVVMVFAFIRSNWPSRVDLTWLRRGGGLFGGHEPPSHRFNAGEKIVFWLGVVVLGGIVVASGLVLDQVIPGLALRREDMQMAHIVHSIAAVFMMIVFLGHIYLGTIGMRGSYQAMKTGYVDEGWAREHHALWYDDIRAGKIPAQRSAPSVRVEQPAS
ncbi:MAG TPA: formate dehydrogenase subunit gamma [Caldimonas sp.]|jgi:formate dehydrogenase subunit gamma|nr:formate dehydrogenase subunit gamma [Caldimonas sp.]HEX2539863.1 formate dehydrogenase subunit gamma [Caldimonas sp.]